NRAEGNDDRSLMAIWAWLGKRDDLLRASCVLHADTRGAHPVVTLRFGDDVEHVALWDHHQPFPRVRFGSDSACFASSDAGGLGQRGHGTVLVIRKFAGSGPGLDGQGSLQLQQVQKVWTGRCVAQVKSQPFTQLAVGRNRWRWDSRYRSSCRA